MLDQILNGIKNDAINSNLLVGNSTKDDAAAYQLSDDNVILSTTDFFMPIVDDAYTFGKIAATNALSDIYAMGGTPMMALAIFGWPINKLPAEIATEVLRGGSDSCKEAGIIMAGGHSIDAPEPIFGLAVTGSVKKENLKTNSGAKKDCLIYLTKPLGIGIITTAEKRKLLTADDLKPAIDAMCTLNKIGSKLKDLAGITAVTDITGFGLLGHLSEICEASRISAVINSKDIKLLPKTEHYLEQGCVPGGTTRNFENYKHLINDIDEKTKNIICDPQTSGGLLIAVKKEHADEFEKFAASEGLDLKAIGYTKEKTKPTITIN